MAEIDGSFQFGLYFRDFRYLPPASAAFRSRSFFTLRCEGGYAICENIYQIGFWHTENEYETTDKHNRPVMEKEIESDVYVKTVDPQVDG